MNNASRNFGLDLYRCAAIFLVLWLHGSFLLKGTVLASLAAVSLPDGVDLFFVLSGYLIGGILLRTASSGTFGSVQLRKFWIRRWFKTLPLYYLVLILNIVVVKSGIIHEDISKINWKYWLFMQNFAWSGAGFFWESWSLPVEEWFYLLSPLMIMAFLRMTDLRRSFLLVTLLLLILPMLYRFSLPAAPDDFTFDELYRKTVLSRMDSIAWGLLAAWLAFYFPAKWKAYRFHALILSLLMFALLRWDVLQHHELFRRVFSFTALSAACALLLPWVEQIRKGSVAWVRAASLFSRMSYAMYLVNLALVAEVIRDNFMPASGAGSLGLWLFYWLAVMVLSFVLYRGFEKPVMELREKWK